MNPLQNDAGTPDGNLMYSNMYNNLYAQLEQTQSQFAPILPLSPIDIHLKNLDMNNKKNN